MPDSCKKSISNITRISALTTLRCVSFYVDVVHRASLQQVGWSSARLCSQSTVVWRRLPWGQRPKGVSGGLVVVVVEGDHQRGIKGTRAHILAASEREVTCATGLLLHSSAMSGIPPMTGRISERPQACRHGVTPPSVLLSLANLPPNPEPLLWNSVFRSRSSSE